MKEKNNKVVVISLVAVILVLIGTIFYMGINNNFIIISNSNDKHEATKKEHNEEVEKEKNKLEDEIKNNDTSINKRLYNIDSEMNKQRYYLLVDDITYGVDQNFLNKRTYILDLNMINGNKIVMEIDLASVFSPIVNTYINEHKGDNAGVCSVEYFSGNKGLTPPPIDYEKEVAFMGYYRCVNNNIETSLGSVIYAYNVETNTIRAVG